MRGRKTVGDGGKHALTTTANLKRAVSSFLKKCKYIGRHLFMGFMSFANYAPGPPKGARCNIATT